MSSLNYMDKLLDGVEVVWMPLAEVVDFKRGEQLKPTSIVPGPYPIVTASKTEVGSYFKWNFGPVSITITSHGAYAGHVNYWSTPIWLANNVFLLSPKNNLLHKFLYYFLKKTESVIQGLAKGGGVPYFNTRDIAPHLIPIPCPDNPKKSLEIQAEIVRILDTFTELTAKLTAELTARKKQYNYYRDQFLSFEDGEVEWRTLGEVATIGTGSHDTQDAIADGKYIFYARGREPLRLNEFDFDETAIITAGDGAGVGKVFHYAEGKYALHQRAYRIVPGSAMNPRFVYHCIKSYFYAYIQKASVSSSVTSLRRPMFLDFPIPAPSLTEQARIVAILDKFDALTESLIVGLPREIELRQKQYAYYRDLLLSFPKPEEVVA